MSKTKKLTNWHVSQAEFKKQVSVESKNPADAIMDLMKSVCKAHPEKQVLLEGDEIYRNWRPVVIDENGCFMNVCPYCLETFVSAEDSDSLDFDLIGIDEGNNEVVLAYNKSFSCPHCDELLYYVDRPLHIQTVAPTKFHAGSLNKYEIKLKNEPPKSLKDLDGYFEIKIAIQTNQKVLIAEDIKLSEYTPYWMLESGLIYG